MEAGIVDPAKVTRFALQNAASLGGLLMTTKATVTEKPKKGKVVLCIRATVTAGGGTPNELSGERRVLDLRERKTKVDERW